MCDESVSDLDMSLEELKVGAEKDELERALREALTRTECAEKALTRAKDELQEQKQLFFSESSGARQQLESKVAAAKQTALEAKGRAEQLKTVLREEQDLFRSRQDQAAKAAEEVERRLKLSLGRADQAHTALVELQSQAEEAEQDLTARAQQAERALEAVQCRAEQAETALVELQAQAEEAEQQLTARAEEAEWDLIQSKDWAEEISHVLLCSAWKLMRQSTAWISLVTGQKKLNGA